MRKEQGREERAQRLLSPRKRDSLDTIAMISCAALYVHVSQKVSGQ